MEHLRNFLLRKDNIEIYSAVLTFLGSPQKDLIDEIVLQCSSEIQAEMAEKLDEIYQLYKNDRAAYENEYRFGQAVIWQEVLSAYKKISNAIVKIQAITLRPDTSNYAQASKEIYRLLCIYSEMQIALSILEQVLGVDRFLDRVSGSTFDVLNEMMGIAKRIIEAKSLSYKNAFQETWNTTNVNKLIRHKLLASNTENQVCDLSTSKSKQVLLFIIDGFGFSQYLWNRSFDSNRTNFTFNENVFNWLSRNNLSKENILGSSYVTDTGAGLAQIYLGQKPGETGIVASKIRKRNDFTNFYATKNVSPNEFDTLFSYKNSITDLVVLGGSASKIYYCSKYQDPPSGFSRCIFKSAEIVPILPPERVFSVLMDDIEDNAEGGLLVVYLTGIDNSGHTMGAYSNFERFEHQKIGWKKISQRPDLLFLIPTKRIHRFLDCIPADWGYGYKNVIIAVSTENQTQADNRLPILLELPIVHKEVFVSPILEYVNLTQYLSAGKIELVSVGGESYSGARICDFDWVQRIKSDCDRFHTPFTFHQTGSLFKLGSRIYNIPHNKEYSQAVKARKILDKVQRQE